MKTALRIYSQKIAHARNLFNALFKARARISDVTRITRNPDNLTPRKRQNLCLFVISNGGYMRRKDGLH
jgi:hypothetical protein